MNRIDFVPDELKRIAAAEPDLPLAIVEGITVPTQPITKLMAELLDVKPGEKVLLIGTGSGYQTAYVAEELRVTVDSLDIRIISGLAERMPEGVRLFAMDGLCQTPEGEIYDAVMATCAVPMPMTVWRTCLKPDGVLVAPVGKRHSHAVRKYRHVGNALEDLGDFAYCTFIEGEMILDDKAVSVFDLVRMGE